MKVREGTPGQREAERERQSRQRGRRRASRGRESQGLLRDRVAHHVSPAPPSDPGTLAALGLNAKPGMSKASMAPGQTPAFLPWLVGPSRELMETSSVSRLPTPRAPARVPEFWPASHTVRGCRARRKARCSFLRLPSPQIWLNQIPRGLLLGLVFPPSTGIKISGTRRKGPENPNRSSGYLAMLVVCVLGSGGGVDPQL